LHRIGYFRAVSGAFQVRATGARTGRDTRCAPRVYVTMAQKQCLRAKLVILRASLGRFIRFCFPNQRFVGI
jgi:hypothetical protein